MPNDKTPPKPETTTQNEEIRVQQSQIRSLCEENQSLREDFEKVRDALLLAAKWGIRSDGFSAEVSDKLRLWVDAGMVGDPPEVPSYYPLHNGQSAGTAPESAATKHP